MTEIDKLVKDGYKFSYKYDQTKPDEVYLAFVSLKLAVKSFFRSSYDIECPIAGIDEEGQLSSVHSIGYCEEYFKSIVHFQHFLEILIKYFLKKENPLLLRDASRNHMVFYKILKGEDINSDEEAKIEHIGFSEAFDRLSSLIKSGDIKNDKELSLFLDHKKTIEHINKLRNRIWHKGIYIIKGESFDLLVGRYIIPLVNEIGSMGDFKKYSYLWRSSPISLGVSPLHEIQQEASSSSPNFGKISLFKRLALSSYNISVIENEENKSFSETKSRAILSLMKKKEHSELESSNISACPVCGLLALINTMEESYIVKSECCHCEFDWFNEFEGFDISELRSIKSA